MVFDKLDNLPRYQSLHPRFEAAINFLLATDLSALPVGRADIDGDNIYVLTQQYESKPMSAGKWEAHRRYIDIQLVQYGAESIGYAYIGDLDLIEYVDAKDFVALQGDGQFLSARAGDFAIFFPEDAHMPSMQLSGPAPVRKIVVKIKV